MNRIKFLKTIINPKFFELPKTGFNSFITSYKFGFFNNKIENIYPYLYISNKQSKFDKFLISKALQFDFLFVKDEVIKNIYTDNFSKNDRAEFLDECKKLKNQMISIVIFPEKDISIFGNVTKVSDKICNLILDMEYDIKFFNLIGTFFTAPIWAKELRRGKTKFTQQFKIEHKKLKELSETELTEKINHYMPSSASVYAIKHPQNYYSNRLAEDFETIVYSCPTCGAFFSLYSEFNCLKCKNCGSATELQPNGEILLSKYVNNYDDLKDYLVFNLKRLNLTNNTALISYENVCQCIELQNNTVKPILESRFSIFADKFTFGKDNYAQEVYYKNIKDFEFIGNNTIKLILSKNDNLIFKGNHKENFYIIHDLINNIND